VAVWTPGSSAAWAATWLGAELSVWNDTVRWLVRAPATPAFAPRLQAVDGVPSVVVDTQQNSGSFVNLALLEIQAQALGGSVRNLSTTEIGPGLYAAPLATVAPGVYRIAVSQIGGSLAQTTALLAVPYAQEFAPGAPDRALLAQLAAASGGALLTAPGQVAAVPGSGGASSDQDLWWGLVALALALFVADVALRQSAWGRLPA
jgi:hypothetical protein